jgi:uroporphyrinogen-III decarboxylase
LTGRAGSVILGIQSIDLNAYCSGHITGRGSGETVLAFPENFVTEAAALGAETNKTSGGFETAAYFITEAAALTGLPCLAGTETIRLVLEQIRGAPKNKTLLLKVSGPYSILASLSSPKLFYRWCLKERGALHTALKNITEGLAAYIRLAVKEGIKIISLADPYANIDILGEKRYREFAADYLFRLIKELRKELGEGTAAEVKPALLHICPHSSIPMTELGYFESEYLPAEHGEYISALVKRSCFRSGLTVLGNRCIYSKSARNICVFIPRF